MVLLINVFFLFCFSLFLVENIFKLKIVIGIVNIFVVMSVIWIWVGCFMWCVMVIFIVCSVIIDCMLRNVFIVVRLLW